MLARVLRSLSLLAIVAAGLVAFALVSNCGWPLGWSLVAGIVAIEGLHVAVLGAEFVFVALAARARAPSEHGAGAVPAAVTLTETGGTGATRLVAPPAGWERRPILRAWLGEIVASLRAFFHAQIWFGDRDLPSATSGAGIPVLFVHGYFCNQALWRPFATRLAARGHAVGSVNLEPVFGSIDDYVPIIAAGIARLSARSGHPRVAIVAHSMGGLAARAYLRAHGSTRIAGMITLGTPHQGTRSAFRGFGRNARQMQPRSRWLNELARVEDFSTDLCITVIVTRHDNIVVPALPQSLPGARAIVFAGLGHVELVYADSVQQAVLEELAAIREGAANERGEARDAAPEA